MVGTDLKGQQEQEWLLNVHQRMGVTVVIPAGCKKVIPVLRMVKVIKRFRSYPNCKCFETTTIIVRNCTSFYVYYINGVPARGTLRYCGSDN